MDSAFVLAPLVGLEPNDPLASSLVRSYDLTPIPRRLGEGALEISPAREKEPKEKHRFCGASFGSPCWT